MNFFIGDPEMFRLSVTIFLVVFMFFAVSCQSSKEKEKSAIEELIKTNAASFEKEQLDAYIATLDSKSPEIENTKAMMIELFKNYDLKLDIESVKILKIAEGEADVEVVQVTRKLTGGDFRDNRIKIIHHLKKTDGKWKITNSTTVRIDYFDQPEE